MVQFYIFYSAVQEDIEKIGGFQALKAYFLVLNELESQDSAFFL